MKLSISLQEEDVGFLDAYSRSQGIRSRSGVVKAVLRLLRTMELAGDYAAARAETPGIVVIRERDHGEAIRGWSEIYDQEFPRQRGRHAA